MYCPAMRSHESRDVASILGTEDGEAAVAEEKNEDVSQLMASVFKYMNRFSLWSHWSLEANVFLIGFAEIES